MLAYERARCRKRIVLADELDGIGVITLAHERNVPGNINVSRAKRLARHNLRRLAFERRARVRLHVAFVFSRKRFHAIKNILRRFVANRAVSRVTNHSCQLLCLFIRLLIGRAAFDFAQKTCKVRQTIATWNAFSARLLTGCFQKRHLRRHGTASHGKRRYAPAEALHGDAKLRVNIFHGHDLEFCHTPILSSLIFAVPIVWCRAASTERHRVLFFAI